MPNLVVIAGPNGAGKSTAAPALLHGLLGLEHFVNADTIARGLSAFDPESVAAEAGRVMLQHLKELAAQRQDFAFETTLASRSFAPWIADLDQGGNTFLQVYLWIPSPDLCVSR
jgi:predicted ABC-type ATPase